MLVSNTKLRLVVAVIFITIVVMVTHNSSIEGGFHFDDDHSIVENPHIRSLENIPIFFTDPSMFSSNEGSAMYRPLLLTTFALNYAWGGYRPEGYLRVNLALHILVCVLSFFCNRLVGIPFVPSFIGSMLFAVHPLVVEPINYVSARSTSLALFFALISMILYVRSGVLSAVGSTVCYGFALCAKSTVIMFPFLLMLIDRSHETKSIQARWYKIVGLFVVSIIYILITRSLIYEAVLDSPVRTLLEQVCTQIKAIVYYLHLAIGMQGQSVDHAFNVGRFGDWSVIFSGILILSIVLISVRCLFFKSTVYSWYFSWIALWLIPTLVVPLNMLVNERRLYEPLIALCVGFSISLCRLSNKKRMVFSALLFVVLITMSVKRTEVWKDENILWEDASSKGPNLVRPYLRLGMWARQKGDLNIALRYYQEALSIDPNNAAAFNNIATVYRMKGRFEDAEEALRSSLLIRPNYTEALINLGSLLSENGRYEEAYHFMIDAEKLSPNKHKLQNNLGTHYLRVGKYLKAEKSLKKALRVGGESARIFYNLGGALEGQGKLKDAMDFYQKALSVDSLYAPPYAKLGILFERFGELENAQKSYRRFLSIWTGSENPRIDVKKRLRILQGRFDR